MPLGVPLAARRQLPLPRKRVSRCRRPLRGGLVRGVGSGRAAAEWQQSCGIDRSPAPPPLSVGKRAGSSVVPRGLETGEQAERHSARGIKSSPCGKSVHESPDRRIVSPCFPFLPASRHHASGPPNICRSMLWCSGSAHRAGKGRIHRARPSGPDHAGMLARRARPPLSRIRGIAVAAPNKCSSAVKARSRGEPCPPPKGRCRCAHCRLARDRSREVRKSDERLEKKKSSPSQPWKITRGKPRQTQAGAGSAGHAGRRTREEEPGPWQATSPRHRARGGFA